MKLLLINIL